MAKRLPHGPREALHGAHGSFRGCESVVGLLVRHIARGPTALNLRCKQASSLGRLAVRNVSCVRTKVEISKALHGCPCTRAYMHVLPGGILGSWRHRTRPCFYCSCHLTPVRVSRHVL
eukprot:scaffold114717_cov32-Tisochrysis_lutea.AAC.2